MKYRLTVGLLSSETTRYLPELLRAARARRCRVRIHSRSRPPIQIRPSIGHDPIV